MGESVEREKESQGSKSERKGKVGDAEVGTSIDDFHMQRADRKAGQHEPRRKRIKRWWHRGEGILSVGEKEIYPTTLAIVM
ncbi:hypothetical protein FKM82_029710 [Ascaphus truei]